MQTYLEAVAAQDWPTAEGCLAPDVVRIGPFGDEFRDRDPYLRYLRDLMPKLPGYDMRIHRVVAAAGSRTVMAELAETVGIGPDARTTPECLVFDLDGAGRIARIAIYIQT